ncbi:recombination protein RecR [Gammaproteobacteria bacterium 45_16_T64]|nr:recombination protein RecR [Gammaproteobacteria bacterium 45_16_T64]
MIFSPLLEQLIQSLTALPGVGPKSAQRMALHLLERDKAGAMKIAANLVSAVENIQHCQQCRIFSEDSLCTICKSEIRDRSIMCVVENPADLLAIEMSGTFRGLYFVLMGHLSPIDGIGPDELGLEILKSRLATGEVVELILATGTTVEGEATAHYIADLALAHKVKASRIAHGVPMGGELEFVDSNTLHLAFSSRRTVD